MASTNRIHRPRKQSATAARREAEIREQFQRDRPSLDDLVQSGDYEPMNNGQFWEVMRLMAKMKAIRILDEKSLRDVAAATGIDHAALSRLENGSNANPTFNTVFRYAEALNKRIKISIVDPPILQASSQDESPLEIPSSFGVSINFEMPATIVQSTPFAPNQRGQLTCVG